MDNYPGRVSSPSRLTQALAFTLASAPQDYSQFCGSPGGTAATLRRCWHKMRRWKHWTPLPNIDGGRGWAGEGVCVWQPSVKVADSPSVRDALRKKALTGCQPNRKHLCRPFSKVKECTNKLEPAAAVHFIQLVFLAARKNTRLWVNWGPWERIACYVCWQREGTYPGECN